MHGQKSVHAGARSRTPVCTRAKATITVQKFEARPYDQAASPALLEISLSETFAGDINGESPVRALQVLRADQSASLVSLQRFRRTLGGRQGTFVIQGSQVVEKGTIKATWIVVPSFPAPARQRWAVVMMVAMKCVQVRLKNVQDPVCKS
jgi:hypothetical protein